MNIRKALGITRQVLCGALALSASVPADAPLRLPNMLPFPNQTGFAAT